mmetsp:Transcript_8824/g.26450  ORF Transcript_8824/g.26450 Transcript_8824/m.26450 type:complete len:111 (-) Transcript_8824:159-491(-)
MKLLSLVLVIMVALMATPGVEANQCKTSLKKCGVDVTFSECDNEPQTRGRRKLKKCSFTVSRKGKKKKCNCNVKDMKQCRRCGGKCCHDLGNGTRECRKEVRSKLCKKCF